MASSPQVSAPNSRKQKEATFFSFKEYIYMRQNVESGYFCISGIMTDLYVLLNTSIIFQISENKYYFITEHYPSSINHCENIPSEDEIGRQF